MFYFFEEKCRKIFGCLNVNMNLVIELEKLIFYKVLLVLSILFIYKERYCGVDFYRIEIFELCIVVV